MGLTPAGTEVDLYTLRSEGIEAKIMTFGARVVSIKTADRDGTIANVVLGYNALDGYLADKRLTLGRSSDVMGTGLRWGNFRSMGISTKCR